MSYIRLGPGQRPGSPPLTIPGPRAPLSSFSLWPVTYSGNGSKAGAVPVDANPYKAGATVTVLRNTYLTRPGYFFKGWNTAANGTGTAYNPGATFSFSSKVTLYAQWVLLVKLTFASDPISQRGRFMRNRTRLRVYTKNRNAEEQERKERQ